MNDFWEGLKNYLLYLERLGVKTLPAKKTFKKFLELDLSPAPRDLAEIAAEIKGCTRCPLHRTRTNIVLGEGPSHTKLMLIGEAPGREEDLEGRPFVGRAGKLLDQMLKAIDIRRTDVYITNVVKCRPPCNRNPESEEIEACLPYLRKQIMVISPKIICTLGLIAAQTVLGTTEPLSRLRGRVHQLDHLKVVVTYHPAFLLRFPANKRLAFEDLKLLKKLYEEVK